MVKETIIIKNETGLHARPATEIAKEAMKYPCEIYLEVNGKKVNAKSPLMIMSAGITAKTELDLVCDGEKENEAIGGIKEIFENIQA